ncbi:MAG TPA: bifunctional hydroxymethylpyrimidine kinase/phosphomethylpyrimidine kinase [Candidatus Limnocylindria bacterium]|jgi:hydroxymethylpyrimidine/phosphomethylpyrimidine kinase|nr:bifunctional hydroxymethylpyrimidine kinase/phosphomethylpyrimidine kinase [Candidatus Limnocylindria bacterium]
MPIALTIAGSDSGGGAGIQADLKVFAALGVHGTSVITAITAQNPARVAAIHAVPGRMVAAQLEAVWEELPPAVVKTGMLGNSGVVKAVETALRGRKSVPLVIDPVIVSTSGRELLSQTAVRTMEKSLFPIAQVITPNRDEAAYLVGFSIQTLDDLRRAALELFQRYGCAVVAKGGHLVEGRAVFDVFRDGSGERLLEAPRIKGIKTHGTGCTFSAALAAYLARGENLSSSVSLAKAFTYAAIVGSRKAAGHDVLVMPPPMAN